MFIKIRNAVITAIVFAGIGFNQCLGMILPSETNQQAPVQWPPSAMRVYQAALNTVDPQNSMYPNVLLDPSLNSRIAFDVLSDCGALQAQQILQTWKDNLETLERWLAQQCFVSRNWVPRDHAELDALYQVHICNINDLIPSLRNNDRVAVDYTGATTLFDLIEKCTLRARNAALLGQVIYAASRIDVRQHEIAIEDRLTDGSGSRRSAESDPGSDQDEYIFV